MRLLVSLALQAIRQTVGGGGTQLFLTFQKLLIADGDALVTH